MSGHTCNAAQKISFFLIVKDLGVIDKVASWCSPVQQQPKYENENAVQAFWDVPVFGEKTELKANSVDAQIINHYEKRAIMLEVSCPWIGVREKKTRRKLLGTITYDGNLNNNIMDKRYNNITLKWPSLEDGLKR